MIKKIKIFWTTLFFSLVCWFMQGHAIAAEEQQSWVESGQIIFSANKSGNWDLWKVQPDGRGLVQITRTLQSELSPSVSPNGQEIIYVDEKRTLHLMKKEEPGARALFMPPGIYAQPTWHPQGSEIMFAKYTVLPSDEGELWRMERLKNGLWGEPERMTTSPPMRIYPSYAPDGSKVACCEFRRDPVFGVVEEIGIMDLETLEFRLITADMADSHHPVWSPKGDAIAYVSDKNGNYDIWIFDLNDKTHRPVAMGDSFDSEPAWSPDGREIVFVSSRTGNKEIWAVSVTGDQLRQVTRMEAACMNPFWVK